jgi:hypothetical protein
MPSEAGARRCYRRIIVAKKIDRMGIGCKMRVTSAGLCLVNEFARIDDLSRHRAFQTCDVGLCH